MVTIYEIINEYLRLESFGHYMAFLVMNIAEEIFLY